jgi:hypothetical protein
VHLLYGIRNIKRRDLFVVLKLEEFVPAVAGHVEEYVG